MTASSSTAGLCAACRHARRIASRRGSVFWLCGRATTDPRYARYPALPVLHCAGHEPGAPTVASRES